MATHFSILAWRIPWTKELGMLQSMGSQESDTTQRLNHLVIPSLGWENALEKEMPTHSSVLGGESHGQRNLVDSMESQKSVMMEYAHA